MSAKPIVVLGAGLSGLSCAVHLHRAKKKVLLLEKEGRVGGRVSTSTRDNFLLDEGFQVLLASYPEITKLVSLESLNLQAFNSGALIFNGEKCELLANPFKHPLSLLSTLKVSFLTVRDIFLVTKLLVACQKSREDSCFSPLTTHQFLRDWGFSEKFIGNFWRPFLAGVFLDQDLSLPADFFLFLVKCFSGGQVTVPSNGMQELPQNMAAQLPPRAILLNTKVQTYSKNKVVLETGEELEAENVVCAFDPQRNGVEPGKKTFRGVTTFYFTSPKLSELTWGKWLILVPRSLGFATSHMVLLSEVAPTYSNSGKPLLSVSVVGDDDNLSLERISKEVNQIAGLDLELTEIYRARVPQALPLPSTEANGFKVIDGVICCGDQWSSPSINGALRSGRLAAEYLTQTLSVTN